MGITPTALALSAATVALLGISAFLTRREGRLSRVAFAITVAIFSAIAVYCVVLLWQANHWGWPGDMPEGIQHPRAGTDHVAALSRKQTMES
jgi:uncharacterized membrane protein YidH (DUF202 family)